MEETTSPSEKKTTDQVRAPYVSLSLSRKMITMLSWCVVGLCATTVILAVSFSASITRKPWVLTPAGNGYEEIGVGQWRVARPDVERFLNFVIPNLYGALNGAAPGLDDVRGLVNEAVLNEQEKVLEKNKDDMKQSGTSQFAIVTGINPDTLVINRKKGFVYAEVMGTIVLTQAKRSEKTEVQWRVLLYIVEPTDTLRSNTPAGAMPGNRMGLYLQQIAEQPPGTVNPDSPKPSTMDLQERESETKKK